MRYLTLLFLLMAGGSSLLAAPVPEVRSPVLRGGQPAHRFAMDVTGICDLSLEATGYSWGQAVWGEAELVDATGRVVRLADLAPQETHVGWGTFSANRGPDGQPLQIADRVLKHGLFAHADSHVVYRLDGKYTRFTALVGVNHTAADRGAVTFRAYDDRDLQWRKTVAQLRQGFTRPCLASLEKALARHPDPAAARDLHSLEERFDGLRQALETDPTARRAELEAIGPLVERIRRSQLDAPLLYVKRHPYYAGHIYDDYLTWHPGGGIYVIENPAAPVSEQRVRAVIDPKTRASLGEGVYRDPELAYDAQRLLFAFKGQEKGDTALYEIRIDGQRLRALTRLQPGECRSDRKPAGLIGEGHHDIAPAYLPDGRIAFLSTRTAGLVMCFNNYIATLHTMNPDGSDVKCISVNNVSEFDPTPLPDGRLLYGRWEYVDKTALYMQSLWTVNPDGSHETAVFKNNLAKPTAVLDARPVPGSELICASLTPHNGQAVGAIAMIDPRVGKNSLQAIVNFTPEYPTEMDQGLRQGPSDPWPLDEDTVLIANNAPDRGPHGVIELIDRFGFRFVIRRDPDISCYSPMLVKARTPPPARPSFIKSGAPARFAVSDIYRGMSGIAPGTVKWLRVIETTARVSGVPPGGRWWNQAFLVSWQGSYDVKNVLGVVPVEADGSAHFEAPPGKALYLQALDADGRLVQSMRTFIQAVPGVTRSCRGCHEAEDNAPPPVSAAATMALRKEPAKIMPESWGRGFIDYAASVQPVLDRRCVSCHGGAEDIAAGLDLSGGWTWAFNLSYESLLQRGLTGFLNCNNGSVKTAEILPPRTHGSGSAPLAKLLVEGHGGRLTNMPRSEIDLLLAWMDANSNFRGTWDYTTNATCNAILPLREQLAGCMKEAGCASCHAPNIGSDWVNLEKPEFSRILRAPLARDAGGLAWCRERKAQPPAWPVITQAQQPPDVFSPPKPLNLDTNGTVHASFVNREAAGYRRMLDVIRGAHDLALQAPRVDMPGAQVIPGECRELPPLSPPAVAASR